MWWIRPDYCGLFSPFLTIALVIFAQYVTVALVLVPWYGFTYHILTFSAICLLSVISHSRTQFADPGAVPFSTREEAALGPVVKPRHHQDENSALNKPVPRICRKCQCIKPYNAHHCSTCKRCILKMDHHCPWVNNCVALFNQKYFILFLFYTFLACIYCGALLVARFVSCTHNLRMCPFDTVSSVLAIICFIEALVFGLFVVIMMFDQFSAIFEGVTAIDQLQNRQSTKVLSKYDSLVEVFGEKFSWRWFMPFDLTPQIHQGFQAEIDEAIELLQEARRTQHTHMPAPTHVHGSEASYAYGAGEVEMYSPTMVAGEHLYHRNENYREPMEYEHDQESDEEEWDAQKLH